MCTTGSRKRDVHNGVMRDEEHVHNGVMRDEEHVHNGELPGSGPMVLIMWDIPDSQHL